MIYFWTIRINMIVKARVKPGSREFSIEKNEDSWTICTKSPAERGRANRELLKELGKEYPRVRILRGLKSRNKVIELG